MTAYDSSSDPSTYSWYTPQIPARHELLLSLCLDFLLDHSRVKTLNQALHGSDPLDLMRMLAQQWSLGLSTLSGDLDHQHSEYVRPSVAATFIEQIRNALHNHHELSHMPNDPKLIYNELLKNMAKNRPEQAAWCAALLWQRPLTLN